MLKNIADFITTGIALILTYVLYSIIAISATFMFGLPIGVGIYILLEFINLYVIPIFGNN